MIKFQEGEKMNKLAFDNNYYLNIQRDEIMKRIESFGAPAILSQNAP